MCITVYGMKCVLSIVNNMLAIGHNVHSFWIFCYQFRAGGTGPADQATAGPKLQKPTTQNFSLLFMYTLIV